MLIVQRTDYVPPDNTAVEFAPAPQYVIAAGPPPVPTKLTVRPQPVLSIQVSQKSMDEGAPSPESIQGGGALPPPTPNSVAEEKSAEVPTQSASPPVVETPPAPVNLSEAPPSPGMAVVYFAPSSAGLSAREMEPLTQLPVGTRWKVTGYASADGSPLVNRSLARRRAAAVERFLIRSGHFVASATGADGGFVDDADPELGKAKSRRVVIEEVL